MAADDAAAALAALAELREHLIKGKEVEVDGEELVLQDVGGTELHRLPKHAPTAYHSKNSDKRYDLLAVYTCYKYATLTFSDYVMKCRAEKATMVSTVDKKELIAYLKGDIETSAQIAGAAGKPASASTTPSSSTAAASGSTSAAGSKSKASAGDDDDHATKKRKLAHESRGKENNHRRELAGKTAESAGDSAIKRVLAKEHVFRNRTTMLDASTKTFENVLKTVELVNAETKERIEKAAKSSAIAPVTARKEQLPLHRLMKDKMLGTPIIVVPAGFSDLFTMLNARDFLEDGVYISNMQKKSEGCRKAQSFMITHEEDGHTYTFKVVDTVARFRDKDWRSVVGVIVSGQSWQFKGWKWKFPLEVFKKVCGVHIYNQGSQLSDEIKQWDVKLLMIHPDKRHLDKVAAKEFWRYLFAFIKLKLQ